MLTEIDITMRKLLAVLLFLLLVALVAFCGEESHSYGEVRAYKYYNGYNYELQLPYHVEGRGNIHQLHLKRYAYEDTDLIYVDTLMKFKREKGNDYFTATTAFTS
ncbi:hypothetical protein GCM10023229_27610 [Flavisolibacter ginsenosidimutans]